VFCLAWPAQAWAVDGISVTAHWTGTNQNLYGGYGTIMRHTIAASVVTESVPLCAQCTDGRNPVINPSGTHVAFLKSDGTIAVVAMSGGTPTILANAQSHGQACLDFPHDDFVYYTKGGFSQPTGSKLLHKINWRTDTDEYVLTFKKNDNSAESGVWRFHIANDQVRAAVRPDDTDPNPAGCVTAVDLSEGGWMKTSRSFGSRGTWRCSTGMDPDGDYFTVGNQPHTGSTVYRWDDLSEAHAEMIWTSIESWGPDTTSTGNEHNRNAWSTNSHKWLCVHIGWGGRGASGANQMLVNWVDHERIVVTDNTSGSYAFDDAGDFWVGGLAPEAPTITGEPADVSVDEGATATFDVSATGRPAPTFQWQRDSSDLGGETNTSYQLTATPSDDGAQFRCVVTNSEGSVNSRQALLTVIFDATPPTISTVTANVDATTVVVVFDEPVDQTTAENAGNYDIDLGIGVASASLGGDQVTVTLTTASAMSTSVTYTLTASNITDRATTPNTMNPASIQFVYDDGVPANLPPVVDAGGDQSVQVSSDLLLSGTVTDDDQPSGTLTITWSLVSGPGNATFATPDQESTFVRFDAEGTYTVRLTGDDSALTAYDELQVTVTPPPSITITNPAGAESWQAGTTQMIEWQSVGVIDVRIDYSIDGGGNWAEITPTVDDTSPDWQSFPWVVPNEPSTEVVIKLIEYSWITESTSQSFTIVGRPQSIDITAPADGATLTAGTSAQIQWTAVDVVSVMVEYSVDDGSSWEAIDTVSVTDANWGDVTWTVPAVATAFGRVRVRTASNSAEDTSGRFTIEAAGSVTELDVTRLTLEGTAPATPAFVDGSPLSVSGGAFTAVVEIPLGVSARVVELRAGEGDTAVRRLIRVELEEPKQAIDGLVVSEADLRAFLGGKGGVLVWVEGGQMWKLEFRNTPAVLETVSAETGCVSPLISPDGTRLVYSLGNPSGEKIINARELATSTSETIGNGDIGFWSFTGGTEAIVYCDWSTKAENGADGQTYLRALDPGTVTPAGAATVLHTRAMDAGPNGDHTWLGQVYDNLWAYDVGGDREYSMTEFFLQDGVVADHQTCNGSMAPDGTGRLMTLVIPHDWVRIFSYESAGDRFVETSRFQLPPGVPEWEFPDWSTDIGFFTAGIGSVGALRLTVVKVADGDLVPEVLQITGADRPVTYSHMWVEP